jgi:hypothetical protein
LLQVNAPLQQFEAGWPTTVAAVRRILDSEQDIEVLREGLARKPYVVIRTIMAQLAGETPQTPGVLETPGVSTGEAPQTSEVSETSEVSADASAAIAQLHQLPLGSKYMAHLKADASAAIAQLHQQWAPVAQAVAAACRGDKEAAAQLDPSQMGYGTCWRH